MDRRTFLTRLASLSGAATVAALMPAQGETQNMAQTFDAARVRNPLLAGFDNAPGDLDFNDLAISGKLPQWPRTACARRRTLPSLV
jgi:hypothetical protein